MTATKELQALLERVEAATGPDRELDARIAAILEPTRFDAPGFTPIRPIPPFRYDSGEDAIRFDGGGIMDVRFFPPVTASIDAALALVERVLPGWGCSLNTSGMASVYEFPIFKGATFSFPEHQESPNLTVALAVIHCLLRALISQSEEKGE